MVGTPADAVEQSLYDLAWLPAVGGVLSAALLAAFCLSVLRRMARNA